MNIYMIANITLFLNCLTKRKYSRVNSVEKTREYAEKTAQFALLAADNGVVYYSVKGGYALQVLVSIIMALLLTVHAVLGCCWHHDHACTAGSQRQCPSGRESTKIFEKFHACDSEHQSGGQKHNRADCKESTCVFIGALSDKLIHSDHPDLPTISLQTQHGCFSPATTFDRDFSRTAGHLTLPIRLHLAYQILLI